jgi:flagellar hook-length control protein FliK
MTAAIDMIMPANASPVNTGKTNSKANSSGQIFSDHLKAQREKAILPVEPETGCSPDRKAEIISRLGLSLPANIPEFKMLEFSEFFGFIKNSDKSEMIASGIFRDGNLPFGLVQIMERMQQLRNLAEEKVIEDQLSGEAEGEETINNDQSVVDENNITEEMPDPEISGKILNGQNTDKYNRGIFFGKNNVEQLHQKPDKVQIEQTVQVSQPVPAEIAQHPNDRIKVHHNNAPENAGIQIVPENRIHTDKQNVKDSSIMNPEEKDVELPDFSDKAEASFSTLMKENGQNLIFRRINEIMKEYRPERLNSENIDKNNGKDDKIHSHEFLSGLIPKDAKIEISHINTEVVKIPMAELSQRVADTVINLYRSGKSGEETFEFAISPPNLGRVAVTLQMQEGVIRSSFVCTPENVDAVRSSLPELRQILVNGGINLGECSVDVGQQHAQWSLAQQQQRQHWNKINSGRKREEEADDKITSLPGITMTTNNSLYNYVI